MDNFTERISYVITEDGYYVGSSVNMPFCIQASSLEELKSGAKEIGSHYLADVVKTFMQKEPFEFVQVKSLITGNESVNDLK
jgi:predicted RNase H-like HicB family nuclease